MAVHTLSTGQQGDQQKRAVDTQPVALHFRIRQFGLCTGRITKKQQENKTKSPEVYCNSAS
jgi:hypothetical protein